MYWTGPLGTRILAIVVSGLGRTCDLATLVTCVPILCAETQKAGPLLHQKLVDKGLFPSSWLAQLGLRQPCRVKLQIPKIGTTDSVFMCFRLNLADRIWVHKMDTKMGPCLHRFIKIEKGNRNVGPNSGPQYGPKNWPRNLHKKPPTLQTTSTNNAAEAEFHCKIPRDRPTAGEQGLVASFWCESELGFGPHNHTCNNSNGIFL